MRFKCHQFFVVAPEYYTHPASAYFKSKKGSSLSLLEQHIFWVALTPNATADIVIFAMHDHFAKLKGLEDEQCRFSR